MKTLWFAALWFAACMGLQCAPAQIGDDAHKIFLEAKAKAEKGDAMEQSYLGDCYANGLGVEKDYVEAYAWWNLGAKTGQDAAKARDELVKRMSPKKVADAQKRTKELRAIIDAKAAGK